MKILAGDWEVLSQSAGGEGEAKRWRDNLASVALIAQANDQGRFIRLEVIPASSKGRKVVFFVPAGSQGSGWVVLADLCAGVSMEVAKEVLSSRMEGQGRSRVVDQFSFADVVRGVVQAPATTGLKKKKV